MKNLWLHGCRQCTTNSVGYFVILRLKAKNEKSKGTKWNWKENKKKKDWRNACERNIQINYRTPMEIDGKKTTTMMMMTMTTIRISPYYYTLVYARSYIWIGLQKVNARMCICLICVHKTLFFFRISRYRSLFLSVCTSHCLIFTVSLGIDIKDFLVARLVTFFLSSFVVLLFSTNTTAIFKLNQI